MTLFTDLAPRIMRDLMKDFGLSVDDAAAVLGNLGHESGGFKFLQEQKPLVKGSRGGWGWAQWTGPRRVQFEAYCKRNNLDPSSYEANYGWLFVELNGSENAAVRAVKSAADLRRKVIAFESRFERAGVKHYDSRMAWAEKALAAHLATANVPDAPVPNDPPVGERIVPTSECIGDSIGVGIKGKLKGMKGRAVIGYRSSQMLYWPGGSDICVFSVGSNDTDLVELAANLETLRARAIDRGSKFIAWVLPVTAARLIVEAFARKHGDKTFIFTTAVDGIHPRSYNVLTDDVLTWLREVEARMNSVATPAPPKPATVPAPDEADNTAPPPTSSGDRFGSLIIAVLAILGIIVFVFVKGYQ